MRWFLLRIASRIFSFLTLLFSPLIVLFARNQYGPIDNANSTGIEPRLPNILKWCSTYDNSLLGDQGHKERWAGKSKYLQKLAWIWRNPIYGFETDVCGARLTSDTVLVSGDPFIKNRANGVAGSYFCSVGKYWNYKSIKPILTNKCLMLEFGWKLQDVAKTKVVNKNISYQLVSSVRITEFIPT